MIEVAIGIVVLIGGTGGSLIGLAWLNDRRHVANQRRLPTADAKAVLEARFAAGDIDEREFDTRMHRLVYGPPLQLEPPDH